MEVVRNRALNISKPVVHDVVKLRIGLLSTQERTFGFHEMMGSS
jgi:hypothetical protein